MKVKAFLDTLGETLWPRRQLKIERARAALELMRAYEAAARGRRTDGWRHSRGTGANAEIATSLHVLRDRHRDLVRNNPWAQRAVEVIDVESVGHGITAEVSAKRLQPLWEAWAESTQCDAAGTYDIYGLQGLMMQAVAVDGEVLVRRRWRRDSDGLPVPMQLQVIEADHLDHSKTLVLASGGRIIQGVEFDAIGRRVAYWLFKEHPGDGLSYRGEPVRVPASEVAHIYLQKRPGQVRGVPWGHSIILTLRDLDEFEDAYLLRNKLANCFMGVLEDGAQSLDGSSSAKLPLPESMEPGAFATLPAGKKITFNSPPSTDGYGNYPKDILHRVAAGYGITYQALTGDLKQVNFSSGRMGWLSMQRNIEAWRWRMLIPQGLDTIARWFIEAAAIQNMRTENATFMWTPPRREMIDPAKEVPAAKDAVRAGFKSLAEIHREYGYSSKKVLQEIADTNKELDRLGLKLDTDPRTSTAAAPLNPAPSKQKDDEEETDDADEE